VTAAYGETGQQPDWRHAISDFLRMVELGTIDSADAVNKAGAIVTELLVSGAVEGMDEIESYLGERNELMRLVAVPMDDPRVPEGATSLDPRDDSQKSHAARFIVSGVPGNAARLFEEMVSDPARNLELLRTETGFLQLPKGYSRPNVEVGIAGVTEEWAQGILMLEMVARGQVGQLGVSEAAAGVYAFEALVSMVADRQASWADIQRFQRSRPAPLFEILAMPVEDMPPMEGATCRDILTGEPRRYAATLLFGREDYPPDHPYRAGVDNHETNLARLAEAGVWVRDAPQ
jgi:hypothetical protein